MRFRNVFMLIGGLLVLLLGLLTDPDTGLITALSFGAGTIATLIILSKSVLYIGMLHLARKGLIDYIDLEVFFAKALQTSDGASRALIAVAIMMVAIAAVMFAAVSN